MNLLGYWKIMRPVDGFLALVAVLAGFFVAMNFIFIPIELIFPLALAVISIFLISGAGITLNDYFDAEIDKINAPHRPIPSGKISKRSALYYSALLFIIGLFLAYNINIYAFLLALLNSALGILYAWKLKKTFLLGNFVDSWFPATSFIYGALVVGSIGTVIWLAALAFLANMGREIYGDLEDVKGDEKAKAETVPIVLGERKSLIFARGFILSAVFLSICPFLLGLLGIAYLMLVLVADAIFIYSLTLKPSQNQLMTKWAMIIAIVAFIAGVF